MKWIWMILILLASCKTVEKSKSSGSSESLQQSSYEEFNLSQTDVVTEVKKSLARELQSITVGRTIIYPADEVFRYSEEQGFEGKADSVVIFKKEEKKESSLDLDSTKIKESEVIIDIKSGEDLKAEREESEESEVSKKPSMIPWIGAAVGLCIVITVIVFWVKRSAGLR